MAVEQVAFRYYNDDNASQASNTAYAAENTDVSLSATAEIILRIQFQNGGGFDSVDPNTLQYSLNGGSYTAVSTGSSVARFYNSLLTDGASTTQRITNAKSFTGGTVVEGGAMYFPPFIDNQCTEMVYAIQIQSGDVSPGDTIDFRSTAASTFAETPRITIAASAPSELTYCAGGDVELEWGTTSWVGPASWVLTESGGDWTLTNGVSTWTASAWDGTGSEVFEIASGTDENLTITVTAGACVCKEHYVCAGKKTGLLTTSVITALIPKNDYRATADPDSTYTKCAGWAAGSEVLNLSNGKAWKCTDAATPVWKEITPQSLTGYVPTSRTLTAGTGLTGGGDLSADRTFNLANTAVTPGSYTNTNLTVDAQGRITAASNGSGGTGTVTSVSGTGTVNGITLTGNVTTSGNLTLGGTLSGVNLASQVTGTLPIANGGTGATTAAGARTALGVNDLDFVGGRLGLSSVSSVSAGGIYYNQYGKHNLITLLDGSEWKHFTFSNTLVSGTYTNSTMNDVFAYASSGTVAYEIVQWTNTTTRATNLTLSSGRVVKSGDATRRYLGSFYIDSGGSIYQIDTGGTNTRRSYIWNLHNQIESGMYRHDPVDSWLQTTLAIWQQMNGSSDNQLEIVSGATATAGLILQGLEVTCQAWCQVTAGNVAGLSIGKNSTSSPDAKAIPGLDTYTFNTLTSKLITDHTGGYAYYSWLCRANSIQVAWYGDNAGVLAKSAIASKWWW